MYGQNCSLHIYAVAFPALESVVWFGWTSFSSPCWCHCQIPTSSHWLYSVTRLPFLSFWSSTLHIVGADQSCPSSFHSGMAEALTCKCFRVYFSQLDVRFQLVCTLNARVACMYDFCVVSIHYFFHTPFIDQELARAIVGQIGLVDNLAAQCRDTQLHSAATAKLAQNLANHSEASLQQHSSALHQHAERLDAVPGMIANVANDIGQQFAAVVQQHDARLNAVPSMIAEQLGNTVATSAMSAVTMSSAPYSIISNALYSSLLTASSDPPSISLADVVLQKVVLIKNLDQKVLKTIRADQLDVTALSVKQSLGGHAEVSELFHCGKKFQDDQLLSSRQLGAGSTIFYYERSGTLHLTGAGTRARRASSSDGIAEALLCQVGLA